MRSSHPTTEASLHSKITPRTSYFRFREDQKRRIEGAAHKPGGKRDWAQVLCNGGIATELALLYLIDVGSAGTNAIPSEGRNET